MFRIVAPLLPVDFSPVIDGADLQTFHQFFFPLSYVLIPSLMELKPSFDHYIFLFNRGSLIGLGRRRSEFGP